MLEPNRLPNAKSVSPFLAAITEVNSSGRLVPKASTVRPMIRSEIPSPEAKLWAESINHSEPKYRHAPPIAM